MGSPVVNLLGFEKHSSYALGTNRQKEVLNHVVYDTAPVFIKFAHTILATEEFVKTENALDALLGSLRLALDAAEAQFWYLIFTGSLAILLPIASNTPSFSYRELLAYGRAATHRIAGTDNVHVLTPVIHYAAMLLDNTAGITSTQQSGVTEHHLYDAPRATIIPVAHNTEFTINNVTTPEETGFHTHIAFYPDYLPSLITRYVYEEVAVERVRERGSDRNLRRVVMERYLSFEFPYVYETGSRVAMPIVYILADNAITSVINKYYEGFQNLSLIASF